MTRTKAAHTARLSRLEARKRANQAVERALEHRQKAALQAIGKISCAFGTDLVAMKREWALGLCHWITANERNGNYAVTELEELADDAARMQGISEQTRTLIQTYIMAVLEHRTAVTAAAAIA